MFILLTYISESSERKILCQPSTGTELEELGTRFNRPKLHRVVTTRPPEPLADARQVVLSLVVVDVGRDLGQEGVGEPLQQPLSPLSLEQRSHQCV